MFLYLVWQLNACLFFLILFQIFQMFHRRVDSEYEQNVLVTMFSCCDLRAKELARQIKNRHTRVKKEEIGKKKGLSSTVRNEST